MKNCFSVRLYRLLLHVYPQDFRARNGEEMLRVFVEGHNAVGIRRPGVASAYFVHIFVDLVRAAARERIDSTDRDFWLAAAICNLFGLYLAYAERHASQGLNILGALLVCAVIIGALRPTSTWRWSLLVAGFVPLLHILVGELHFGHRPFLHTLVVEAGIMAVAAIAALAGGRVGGILRSYPNPIRR